MQLCPIKVELYIHQGPFSISVPLMCDTNYLSTSIILEILVLPNNVNGTYCSPKLVKNSLSFAG